MTDSESRLEGLLSENVVTATEREASEFDQLTAAAPSGFVIFGAGNMGRFVARKLRSVGVAPLAFTDNNTKLWGQSVEGLAVLSPQDAAARYGGTAAFVISIWAVASRDRMAARVAQLRGLGCRCVLPFTSLFWKYPDLFLPYKVIDQPRKVIADAEAVRRAGELWADEFSRTEYTAQIGWRLRGDFDAMADPVPQAIYFPDDLFRLTSQEVFIDCGAFDGDTLRSILDATGSRFKSIVAFEPDPTNYQHLRQYVQALPLEVSSRVETRPVATGAANGKVRFSATGTDGSAIGDGDLEVDCVALDTALPGITPTHIKMDIEGAELDALEGARQLIGRHAPVLAICAYHRQFDLWRIPLLIHDIRPDYRLYLRPHLMEGWDSVCYAIPPERAIG